MRVLSFVLVAFIAGCGGGGSSVSTSSTPPNGGGSDGGVGTPMPGGGGGVPGSGGGGAGGSGGGAGGGGAGGIGGGGGGSGGSGGTAMCTLAGPTQLATTAAVAKMIADGPDLYYFDGKSAKGGVWRVPSTGGSPTLVLSVVDGLDDHGNLDFVVDDRAVYVKYDIEDDTWPNPNAVTIVDKTTLATRKVAAHASGCTVPVIDRLAAVGGTLWMTQHNLVHPQSGCSDAQSYTIEELDAGATQSRTLTTIGFGRTPILADQTHVFWSGDQGTFRALHDGTSVEMLADQVAYQLVSDGNTLFANDDKVAFAITAPLQYHAIFHDGRTLYSSAVDDRRVYLGTEYGLIAIDKSDGSVQTVLPGFQAIFAVDATNIYWSSGNSIMTMCKP